MKPGGLMQCPELATAKLFPTSASRPQDRAITKAQEKEPGEESHWKEL